MTKYDHETTLWAISALSRYAPEPLETAPTPRTYAPEPFVDYHAEIFKRQCARDAKLREVMQIEEDREPRWQDERSYEQFGEEEQGYHGDRR